MDASRFSRLRARLPCAHSYEQITLKFHSLNQQRRNFKERELRQGFQELRVNPLADFLVEPQLVLD